MATKLSIAWRRTHKAAWTKVLIRAVSERPQDLCGPGRVAPNTALKWDACRQAGRRPLAIRWAYSMSYRLIILIFLFIFSSLVRASDDASATVINLYKDFSWETVIVDPNMDGLIDQPLEVLQRYFDDRLSNLIVKDRQCVKHTHEICALDFMPIWDSQDVGASDLSIKSVTDKSVVDVTFVFAESHEKRHLKYQLAQTARGWRISDIRAESWSLLSLLSQKQ